MSTRAIFLDRDGVINHNRNEYVKHWSEFVFLPRVFTALRQLNASDYWVIVVTNQSAIGRGLLSRGALEALHSRMLGEVRRNGGRIDAVLYCPHHPDEGCNCRKPQAGMLHEAARRFDLELRASYLVGDSQADVMAALAAGVSPLLVGSGHGLLSERRLRQAGATGYRRVADLHAAVATILSPKQASQRASATQAAWPHLLPSVS